MHNHLLDSPIQPSLKQAFWYWLKLGFISFGGPAGQIAIMHQDLVENKRWISEKRFLHALNYCMVLPGPEAQQLAVYIGWLLHKTWGGVVAGSLFVLPSLFILMGLTFVYLQYGNLAIVASILYAIKPAVVAIVLFAAYRIGSRNIKNIGLASIAALSFCAISIFGLPFPLIILSAALLGFVGGRYYPNQFSVGSGHQAADKHYGKALIDDDTPTPSHAVFSLKRMIKLLLVGLLLWLVSMMSLAFIYGVDAVLTQMAWFFTKAAMLTFGGAYAVLPYVYQGAVTHYQWLSPAQMMDGLALGETTPGPLIMVLAFVGFVGGWTHEVFGVNTELASGIAAACVVTWFTFLPSFIFIFMGAPLIESTQGKLKFTAPLTAITAAVVGVILSLAVFFAQHIFTAVSFTAISPLNHLNWQGIDWLAVLITSLSYVALWRYKVSVIRLIFACALLGWLLLYLPH